MSKPPKPRFGDDEAARLREELATPGRALREALAELATPGRALSEELAASSRASEEFAAALAAQSRAAEEIAAWRSRPFAPPQPPAPLPIEPRWQEHTARVMREIPPIASWLPQRVGEEVARQIAEAVPVSPAPKPRLETRGRPRGWAYEEAGLAVLSAILRGKTAKPTTQAEVKRLLRDWLQEHYADEPADSKLREHANLLLTYIQD